MPYTLTSLGAYLAQAKRTMPIIATTALIRPSSSPYTPYYYAADSPAALYWSRSLATEHPTLHASGHRAVAVVSTAYMLAVVPFSWLPRLPLQGTRALELPKERLTPITVTKSVLGSTTTMLVGMQNLTQYDHLEVSPHRPQTSAASGEQLRSLYEHTDAEVEWWRSRNYSPERIGVLLEVSPDLRQTKFRQGRRRHPFPEASRYYRRVEVSTSSRTVAEREGRPVPATSHLHVLEEVFRVFAVDKRDFDQHFLLRYVEHSFMFAVLERHSGLLVGLIPGTPYLDF